MALAAEGRKISQVTQEKLSPAFNRLWSSSAASNVVDGLLKTAAPLLAITLTTDPFWISLIAALIMLPWLLFAIPVGGMVDRIHRRTLLAVANGIRLTAAGTLAISIGFDLISLPILLFATFLFGIGEVIYDTTLQSMIPEVLETNQLEKGNARLQVTSVTLGEFIGTPIGGFLFAVSIALPFYMGVVGIVVAIALVLAIPKTYSLRANTTAAKEQSKFWSDIKFGIRYLYESKPVLKLVLLTSAIGFFFAASSSTMVLFLTQTLKAPIELMGVLLALPAIGALVGSVSAQWISQRFGRTVVMAWSMVISSALMLVQGFAPNYWTLGVLVTTGSAVVTFWNILLMATYHQVIPSELFGRIHGTRRTLVWGLMPVGSILGGLIATVDLRLPFIVGGAACLALAIIGFRFVIGLKALLVEPSTADEG